MKAIDKTISLYLQVSHRTTESNTLQGYTISAIDSERDY